MAGAVLQDRLARRFEAVVLVGARPEAVPAPAPLLRWAGDLPEAVPAALEALWQEGISPSDVLVLDDGTGPPERVRQVRRLARSCVVVSARTDAVLADQVRRRARGELPQVPDDPLWTLTAEGLDPERERVWAALLTVSDGRVGVTGAPVAAHSSTHPATVVAGAYDGKGARTHLVPAPLGVQMPYALRAEPRLTRVLDLRSGVLHERGDTTRGELTAARFACLTRPGTVVLRTSCPDPPLLEAPLAGAGVRESQSDVGADEETRWRRIRTTTGAVTAAAHTTTIGPPDAPQVADRVVAYVSDVGLPASPAAAVSAAHEGARTGFDRLLEEQRQAWAVRWDSADVTIQHDPELQRATRLMLFHLMGSVGDRGEAAVGARGLTGQGYAGHVFWDADTFVLPFLAATHPAAARAMLEYRIRRLPRALAAAQALGRAGARFPWESADSGDDVTPTTAYNRAGRRIDVRTGRDEEHIVAEVAWAASTYVEWTGDRDFAVGPGLRLLIETARWWASRAERDPDGSAHLRGVIGPDEYHEDVDDNAFTNVMARWNLRRAAAAVEDPAARGRADVAQDEPARWRELAQALVDGYDPGTGRHEQFAGFFELEPLIIAEVAPRRPIAADVLMGRDRVQATQVVKQPDVLMLHHLVPDELPAGSLLRDLDYYEPRTAHGSSLSPGIHACLLARAGRTAPALDALAIAARIDLDDLTRTTAAGIHVATAGSLWQALAWGFAGVRPGSGRLAVTPRVPPEWGELSVRLRYQGSSVVVRCREQRAEVVADPPVPVLVNGEAAIAAADGLHAEPRNAPGGAP